jgi:CPA1 family monovalent cation:H+ antiporter
MTAFQLIALVVSVTAMLAFLNERFLRLPTAIGVTVGGLLVSLALVLLGRFGFDASGWAEGVLGLVDLDELVMRGMLGVLLFAGALHVNLEDLLRHRWSILTLATLGVIVSTAIVGVAAWAILNIVGLSIPLSYALLFGALISPTDPIAVMGVLRSAGAPRDLEVLITGESLFNDGVGVVVFALILGFIASGGEISASHAGVLFAEEALGGAALGLALGGIAYATLRRLDNASIEILVTLAIVTGGYALAGVLHTSGPIAMVVAGLLIGNHGRRLAMSDTTRDRLDTFWLVADEILNTILFVLIGLELLVIDFTSRLLLAGALMIPATLAARAISVGLPIALMRARWGLPQWTVRLLTWGGLRGGIAIALALSLPEDSARPTLLGMTYIVVVFSLLVQGLTVGRVAGRAAQPTWRASAQLPSEDGRHF